MQRGRRVPGSRSDPLGSILPPLMARVHFAQILGEQCTGAFSSHASCLTKSTQCLRPRLKGWKGAVTSVGMGEDCRLQRHEETTSTKINVLATFSPLQAGLVLAQRVHPEMLGPICAPPQPARLATLPKETQGGGVKPNSCCHLQLCPDNARAVEQPCWGIPHPKTSCSRTPSWLQRGEHPAPFQGPGTCASRALLPNQRREQCLCQPPHLAEAALRAALSPQDHTASIGTQSASRKEGKSPDLRHKKGHQAKT
ncbi:hypothetical protein Anapl_00667 [Anas platyrhynchos]|uniref:Uncharacterized protein n=1 Tax=Anas platyrhynchos TaxID=8839 RepID=R0K050_ANAPL|nr:hypothetical protein Anapl_00667 [Anas platyrhynchos]